MKRIAVPARDGHIDDHFGHCDHYLIYSVEEKKIIDILGGDISDIHVKRPE